nr:lanthionine synthetase C family protein [Allomuricauda sp.]
MKEKLEPHIRQLAQLVQAQYHELESIGTLGGQAGAALFQFYCAEYFNEDSYSDAGVEIIGSCIDIINNGYSFPSYCNGIAGFGWALQHLVDQNFIELDLNELLTPFDGYFLRQMEFEFKDKHYDLLHGALGYGFYFLKRFSSPNISEQEKNRYEAYLEQVLDSLEKMAINEGDGLKWESVLDIRRGNKGINLSLSHGMSSVIYLVSKLHATGFSKTRTEKLLTGALKYIERFENKEEQGISLYPSWVETSKTLEYKSRLAWCYGDIGIGKSWGWAGHLLNNQEMLDKAQYILAQASKRRLPEETMVVDSGYCHGSFGNAHLFRQFGQQYDNSLFHEAAKFWIDDGLARYTGNLEEPFQQLDGRDHTWRFELNLLEGISGIGLVMIDFLSPKQNTWDECLMLR